jgi:outer membrane protein
MRTCYILLAVSAVSSGQVPGTPEPLDLAQAQEIAIRNHPAVRAALLNSLAANQVTIEVRSAALPTVTGSVTGAGAVDGSRIAAGGLNNPIIYDRLAAGVTVSQLITDFGRTSNLAGSARLRAQAQQQSAQATRAQVLLQVDRAYFSALRAQKVLSVTRQTVAARQVVADQVSALAESKLKSGLDVSFANVNLSEAKLMLASAENDRDAAMAELSVALGYPEKREFTLAETGAPSDDAGDLPGLLAKALKNRPEVASLRTELAAAERLVKAERALQYPTLSALAAVGGLPVHEDTLTGRYAAAGVNLNVPIFNGHLFSARKSEAELRAQSAAQSVRDLENRVARDVQVAWLNSNMARRRLSLTAELLAEAAQALDLAQTRYDLGLSSIVELTQAQLNQTAAEIGSATARYDYALARAELDYQVGALQ